MAALSNFVRARGLLPAGLLAATVLFFIVYPLPRSDSVLLWDQCHHLSGGLAMRDALASGSPPVVVDELLAADLYPAGHSFALGTWLLVVGDSPLSHQFFQLAMLWLLIVALRFCATCVEAGRRTVFFAAAVFFILITSRVIPLAGTFMLGVPATALAVAALAALVRLDMHCSRRRAVIALLLTAGALLTKYNVALPLVPVALALGLRRLLQRDRGAAVTLAAVAAGSVLILVLYLTLQDNGWEMFFRFARNRSNSADWTPWARCAWYLRYYSNQFLSPLPLSVGLGVLALVGVARIRSSLALASAAYVVCSLGALSCHEYLLGRTLLPAAVIVTIPAAIGLGGLLPLRRTRWPRLRQAGASLLLISALALAYINLPAMSLVALRYYPPQRDMAELSDFVAGVFRGADSCRVIGTFNAFSGGWTRILWRREHGRGVADGLRLEFPRPEATGPDDADPARLRFCSDRLDRWLTSPSESLLLTLEVLDDSPMLTKAYRRHGAWKDDYVQGCDGSPGLELLQTRKFPDCGVRVRVHAPKERSGGPGTGTITCCPCPPIRRRSFWTWVSSSSRRTPAQRVARCSIARSESASTCGHRCR